MILSEESLEKCTVEIQNDYQSIYFKENIQGINEYPYNCPDGEISYRLNSFTNDIAKERLQHRAVTITLRACNCESIR